MKPLIPLLLLLVLFGCAKKEDETTSAPAPETTAAPVQESTAATETATAPTATVPATTGVETPTTAVKAPATGTTGTVPAAATKPSVPSKPATMAPPPSSTAAPEPTHQPAPSPVTSSSTPAPQPAPPPVTATSEPAPAAAPAPAPSPAVQPAASGGGDATKGASIVKTKCAPCHGPDGSGKTSMGAKYGLRNWRSDGVQAQPDTELTRILHEGKGKVSAAAHKSKALSAQDVENVIAFIRSLKQ